LGLFGRIIFLVFRLLPETLELAARPVEAPLDPGLERRKAAYAFPASP
jgi:hypothetical protein